MRCIGVDPGIANTGWSVVERYQAKSFYVVTGGVIRTSHHLSEGQRLHQIYEDLTSIIKKHSPDLLTVENVYFNNNKTSALSTAGVASVCLLIGELAGIQSLSISPQQAKSAVTGSGSASKKQVQQGVCRLTGREFKNHHIADSVAIAAAGLLRSRSPAVRLPKLRCS